MLNIGGIRSTNHPTPSQEHPWRLRVVKEMAKTGDTQLSAQDNAENHRRRFVQKVKMDYLLEEADNVTDNIIEGREVDLLI